LTPDSPGDRRQGEAGAASPCTDQCRLNERGVCAGCGRTLAEIAAWESLSEAERRRVLARLARENSGAPSE
jgi:predicted Fe-S protein YdhL (DUF1289 family)